MYLEHCLSCKEDYSSNAVIIENSQDENLCTRFKGSQAQVIYPLVCFPFHSIYRSRKKGDVNKILIFL